MAAKVEAEKQDAESKKPYAKEGKAEPPKVTKENVGDAVRAAVAVNGKEKVEKVIKSFGVLRATAAPEEKWAEIIAALKVIQ